MTTTTHEIDNALISFYSKELINFIQKELDTKHPREMLHAIAILAGQICAQSSDPDESLKTLLFMAGESVEVWEGKYDNAPVE